MTVTLLNGCDPDVRFDRSHIVDDVLLNPGPADENIDNILEEVLQVQDVSLSGEDMDEVESEDELPAHQDPLRPKIYSVLKNLTKMRNEPLTKSMLPHRLEQWKKHIKCLEELATDCFTKKPSSAPSKKANVPATRSTAAIPSTSAVEKPSDVVSSTTTTSTLMNVSTYNHSDAISNTSQEEEVQINTISDYESVYTDLLGPTASIYDNNINAEVVHDDTFEEEDSLPALHVVKEDPEPYEVTYFRPLVVSEKKKRSKFERYTEESSLESLESLDETDKLHYNKNK